MTIDVIDTYTGHERGSAGDRGGGLFRGKRPSNRSIIHGRASDGGTDRKSIRFRQVITT